LGGKKHTSNLSYKRKKKGRCNGLLAVDLFTSECFFQANKTAKSEQIAQYFADLSQHFEKKGITKIELFLDNNPTHKKKMQDIYEALAADFTCKINFHFIAPYSPKLNLVEYIIHKIRQNICHHADAKKDIEVFESEIQQLCLSGNLTNIEQIINTLQPIQNIALDL
jgi:transposase